MKSLQLNHIEWGISELGETALILKPRSDSEESLLSHIHSLSRKLRTCDFSLLVDIIPAYEDLTLIFKEPLSNPFATLKNLSKLLEELPDDAETRKNKKLKVPVCYDLGLDWPELTKATGLSKTEIVEKHTETEYTVAMMGFMPGFLYLSGINDDISCNRKANPRTRVPAGSVGLAGSQTGIYSLQSPGGWQIIGRTPLSFFDVKADPPNRVEAGDILTFYPIDRDEFESYGEDTGD